MATPAQASPPRRSAASAAAAEESTPPDRAIVLEERVEDLLRLVGEHAFALVVHLERELLAVGGDPHQHVAAVGAELDRVVDHVPQRLLELALVAPARLRKGIDGKLERDPA